MHNFFLCFYLFLKMRTYSLSQGDPGLYIIISTDSTKNEQKHVIKTHVS